MDAQLFVLGRTPTLSIAELAAVCWRDLGRLPRATLGPGFLMLPQPIADSRHLIARLGGTVKIGRLLATGHWVVGAPLAQAIADLLPEARVGRHRTFGVSFLGEQHPQRARRLVSAVKEALAERGLRARFVPLRQGSSLSSVTVEREGLLTAGAEILIGQAGAETLLARTEAVQPFERLSARDYGRPERNELAGLLPPKLAIAMLNLSRLKTDAVLLDPFCGSGTVLQEAELLGFRTLLGADAKEEAVRATQVNLRWLRDRYEIDTTSIRLKVRHAPVSELPDLLGEASVDGIVTEPFLGPPLKRKTHPRIISDAVRELSGLYGAFFRAAGRLLKPGGRLVTIVPMLRTGKQSFREPVVDPTGFTPDELLPPSWGFRNNRVIYGRPDQHVFRKIVVYRKR